MSDLPPLQKSMFKFKFVQTFTVMSVNAACWCAVISSPVHVSHFRIMDCSHWSPKAVTFE